MKEFIFNDCSVCLNPNRISRKGDKYDEFEISTAEHEGKWGVGVSYFYHLGGMSYGVSLQRCTFDSEVAAILHGVSVLRQHLCRQRAKGSKIYQLLNEVAPDSLQLSLF